jgi:uncharacterized repeat protein (TIGR01451 family)
MNQRIAAIGLGTLAVVALWSSAIRPVAAQGIADLAITKIADRHKVRFGQNVVYTITVTNHGPDVATEIVFGDSVPDWLNWVEFTCSQGEILFPTFCRIASLEPGESATATLIATPDIHSGESRRIDNTAGVSSSTPDPDSANNTESATIMVVGKLPR